ncbi:maestro heat-like repeat-containing protein family member 1 [Rhinolophus sinicus]|uniref:maestro heat-like repeat-containing protein family member 1 n=1 Tax=Rhinolophus sinicus TaxID=89399 RepID=UPI003D7C1105
MAGSSETAEGDLECDISGGNVETFIETLQLAGQMSADTVLQTLKLLEVKILNNKMGITLYQKVTDVIVNYLRTMKPEGELEDMCTVVLLALGSHSPGMVIIRLWDKLDVQNVPPRSLLVAVGKLILCQGTASYIGVTWGYVLHVLAQEENDMLALCHVLYGLVISAQRLLELGADDDEIMDITKEEVSIKAYHTFWVFFNRWSLKNKDKVTEQVLVIIGRLFSLMSPSKLKNEVKRLIRWLMILISTKVTSFYISQCICQLVGSLARSDCRRINVEFQLENITGILFTQLSEEVNNSDPNSVKNHILTLKAFHMLTKLYSDQVVFLIRKTMESKDPAKAVSALQVFMNVFEEVPQTEKLQRDVMHSTIIVIQDNLKPVRKALLNFIEMLGHYDYFTLPQGDIIINFVIKLSESDPSNEENIRIMCSRILQMVRTARLKDASPFLLPWLPDHYPDPQPAF